LAVLDSPRPIGRYEASDSHGVIVTCFGSGRPVKAECWWGRQLCPHATSRRSSGMSVARMRAAPRTRLTGG
jgi:hypothetical protein